MSRFHILCYRTRFRHYHGCLGPVLMFCAPGLIYDGTECDKFCFHVLRSRTHFGRYRGRRVPFSCFALPGSFGAVPRASGPVLMFGTPGLIFGRTEGARIHFHVILSRSHFRRYRERRVPFSYFAFPNSFSALPRASNPVLSGTEDVGFWFHILRTRIRFGRYRGSRVSFSCFALPDSIWAVPRAPGPIFMFGAPGPVLCGTEGAGYRFYILQSRTHFRQYRGRRVPFACFVLQTRFGRYRGRQGQC
jgi:hypothetical protein